ncbi:MAG: hypothetical protein LBC61_03590 [Candidatus Peribacteria bacterium]|nr:hypothetical protein [Candidatus Peribacteria bacterium]
MAVSFSLFAYNKYIIKQVEALNSEISGLKETINDLNSKKEIQVYALLENNKGMIEELEKRSKVSEYIRHLKSLYPENVH